MQPRGTVLVVAVAAFLLLSMGGAIAAAPFTLPLLYVGARRHPTRPFRAVGGLVAAFTIAEVVWAAVYVSLGESGPWIWLLPVVGALTTVVAFVRAGSGTGTACVVRPEAG